MTRADLIDAHGTRHRFGCDMPGWSAETSATLPDVIVRRCLACGAIHLTKETK